MNFFLSLCCVFISFIFYDFFFFYHFGVLIERGVHFFSVAFKYNKLCVSSALLDNELFSFHFEFCANLPPGRHTMILYCNIIQGRPTCKSFRVICGHM